MSRYKMIAREDLELHAKEVVKDLEAHRRRMYHSLEVLPVTEKFFEARDALNSEINASLGEQRAWRAITEWVRENYRSESEVIRHDFEDPMPDSELESVMSGQMEFAPKPPNAIWDMAKNQDYRETAESVADNG